ncbi:MAG: ammonia channel protein, partial [Burkholderiaceae bacterium]
MAVGLACSAAQAADPLRAREAALGLPYGEPSLATDTQAAQAEPAKAPDPVAARAASAPAPAAAESKAKPAAPRRAG